MRFKIDENLPSELLDDLREAGHDAETVPDEGIAGAPDQVVLERVRSEGRVLLTMDKGIGDVRIYPPRDYAGIILFRLRTSGRSAVLASIRRQLPTILGIELAHHLLVVTDHSVRIR